MPERTAWSVALVVTTVVLTGTSASLAQTEMPVSIDSAIGVTQFMGENAPDHPDIVVDITAAMKLGNGWVAYVRPWFRRAGTEPHTFSKQIYQAALQHERAGRVNTRLDLGYILSPIGLGMLDMRPDTNPTVSPHLSYLVPMPAFEVGAPSVRPIASSYPLGGQVTVSTTWWDARAAVLSAPPNRPFVINPDSPNPPFRPFTVAGGGITPRTGLRIGAAYATGEYAMRSELRQPATRGRTLHMVSLEGEFAFGYTKITGEVTRDSIDTATEPTTATAWFLQGTQTLSPRWFAAARIEGVNAPPRQPGGERPTLRMKDVTVGFRVSRDITLRGAYATRKTYSNTVPNRQAGLSLVWARRWW